MNENDVQRRLSAILAADVVGYTRLMELDTDGTVAAWQAARSQIIDPAIADHSGRIVKHTGDGFLAEFPTVQDAVKCAVSMQEALAANPLDFRMGINLGDIVDDGEDIHGEGVNIAARIEALAEPGGISISGGIYGQVLNRLDCRFENLGEHTVKHVSAPVRVYAIRPQQAASSAASEAGTTTKDASVRPAIAVLPFDNMSGDDEQEYFVDGITEDIITELSKFRWLTVIARNSTFVYKGQATDIPKVARELDVGYVLEGSVRRSGQRVRITAQLIEAPTNEHIWAERYDRQLEDIFDLQDEMTQTIVGMIEPELAHRERERTRHRPTENMNAWELYQRGLFHRWRVTPADIEKAHGFFDQAIALDAGLASAHAHRAWTIYIELMMNLPQDRAQATAAGLADARRAIELNDRDPLGYCAHGFVLVMDRRSAEAVGQFRRSLELNPSFATAYYGLGLSLNFDDPENNAEESLQAAEMAMRLSPNDPLMWAFLNLKGITLFFKGDYEAAREAYVRASQFQNVMFWIPLGLAACCWELGEEQRARDLVEQAKVDYPGLTMAPLRGFAGPATEFMEHFFENIRKAGLSD